MVRLIKDDVELRLPDQDWEEFRLWQNERVYPVEDLIADILNKHGVEKLSGRGEHINTALTEIMDSTELRISELARILGKSYGWVFNRLHAPSEYYKSPYVKLAEKMGKSYACIRWRVLYTDGDLKIKI